MYMIYIMSSFNDQLRLGQEIIQSSIPRARRGRIWFAACLEIFRQHITAGRMTQSVHVDNHKGTVIS
jgi:hypothetical protein